MALTGVLQVERVKRNVSDVVGVEGVQGDVGDVVLVEGVEELVQWVGLHLG